MFSIALAFAAAAALGSTPARSQTPPPQPAEISPAASLSAEGRGDLYMARKMYREAIEAYSEGARKNAAMANKLGIAWHQLGQLEKARTSYQLALKIRPQYSEAQNNLGTVYYANKSYRRAISAYKKAIKLNPNSPSFHMNLGTAYFSRKMEKEAMVEYQTALNLDPEVFESRGTFGFVLEERNVEEKAKYHYSLAKLYAMASRNELALQYLRKALEEGFKDKKKMEKDTEWDALRATDEFKALLALEPRVL